MKVFNKEILFIVPTPRQPRFHRRIFEYQKENNITLIHFERDKYNSQNRIPEVDKCFNLGFLQSGNYTSRVFKLIKLFRLIKKQIDRNTITFSFGLDLLLVSVLAKKNNQVWFEIGDLRGFKNKYLEKCFNFIYKKFIFKQVDFFSVTSDGFKNYLIDKFSIAPNKIVVKENFVLRNDFLDVNPEKKDLPEQFIVGIVGFLRYKTILSFLDEYIKNNCEKFLIHIYGQGPVTQEIIKKIKNTNIKYFGEFKYPTDIENIYKSIHFSYVLYDNNDINVKLALPNKLYESIFFKTPILVSNNTYLCQEIHKFQIGKCFHPEDQSEIIEYLRNNRLSEDYYKYINNIDKIDKKYYEV